MSGSINTISGGIATKAGGILKNTSSCLTGCVCVCNAGWASGPANLVTITLPASSRTRGWTATCNYTDPNSGTLYKGNLIFSETVGYGGGPGTYAPDSTSEYQVPGVSTTYAASFSATQYYCMTYSQSCTGYVATSNSSGSETTTWTGSASGGFLSSITANLAAGPYCGLDSATYGGCTNCPTSISVINNYELPSAESGAVPISPLTGAPPYWTITYTGDWTDPYGISQVGNVATGAGNIWVTCPTSNVGTASLTLGENASLNASQYPLAPASIATTSTSLTVAWSTNTGSGQSPVTCSYTNSLTTTLTTTNSSGGGTTTTTTGGGGSQMSTGCTTCECTTYTAVVNGGKCTGVILSSSTFGVGCDGPSDTGWTGGTDGANYTRTICKCSGGNAQGLPPPFPPGCLGTNCAGGSCDQYTFTAYCDTSYCPTATCIIVSNYDGSVSCEGASVGTWVLQGDGSYQAVVTVCQGADPPDAPACPAGCPSC